MNSDVYAIQLRHQIWALYPGSFAQALTGVGLHTPNAAAKPQRRNGRIGMIGLFGILAPRAEGWPPWCLPLDRWTQKFRELASQVDTIVIDCDSPGGAVSGTSEAFATVLGVRRSGKRVIAQVDSLMASAAYWICSAADEIAITPGGQAGSIGVFAAHTDYSRADEMAGMRTTLISAGKYKTEGNQYEPLGDEARGAAKDMVNSYYSMFVADVARGREVSADTVRSGFGQGRLMTAKATVKAGLCDRLATLEETLVSLGTSPGRGALASSDEPPVLAKTYKTVRVFGLAVPYGVMTRGPLTVTSAAGQQRSEYAVVRRGAFYSSLRDHDHVDLRLGHDDDCLIADTASGSLKLWDAADGLHFSAELRGIGEPVAELLRQQGGACGVSVGVGIRESYRSYSPPSAEIWTDVRLKHIALVDEPAFQGAACCLIDYRE